MVTDKIKVAVRVRPFSKRGKNSVCKRYNFWPLNSILSDCQNPFESFFLIKLTFFGKKLILGHAVRKSQIVSKNSIFEKITKLWIWIFVPKWMIFLVIMLHWFLLEFENTKKKWSKFNIFNYCWFCTYIKLRFLARKINLSR